MTTIGQDENGIWCVFDSMGACLFKCGDFPSNAADICHYLNGGNQVSSSVANELMSNSGWRNEERVK